MLRACLRPFLFILFFPKDEYLGVLKSIATTTCRWVSEGGGAGRVVGGSGGRPQPGNPGPAGRCSGSAGREHKFGVRNICGGSDFIYTKNSGAAGSDFIYPKNSGAIYLRNPIRKRHVFSKNFPAARAIYSL